MKKAGMMVAGLYAIAAMAEMGAIPPETTVRQAGKDTSTPSTLNGKQKAARKAKNKQQKASRKINRK